MADSLKTPVELCGHCGRDGEMVGHIHSYLDKRFLAVCISLLWTNNTISWPDIWTSNKQTVEQYSRCQRLVLEMTTQFLYQYQQPEAFLISSP